MPEPEGWDDPRQKPDTGEPRRKGLLLGPDEELPSPKILKLALLAAAIIVVIALILYFKARKAPPALRDRLQLTPRSLNARDISRDATSNRKSWLPGAPRWKQESTVNKQPS
ncbi:MAG TPA: hypothetical protein VJN21_00010 [Candidatus Acidoferrales bacterium]|nr:hypothetical protein [Candidatus Acidoferrales bacterium]